MQEASVQIPDVSPLDRTVYLRKEDLIKMFRIMRGIDKISAVRVFLNLRVDGWMCTCVVVVMSEGGSHRRVSLCVLHPTITP